jgi:hypothetical protein
MIQSSWLGNHPIIGGRVRVFMKLKIHLRAKGIPIQMNSTSNTTIAMGDLLKFGEAVFLTTVKLHL